METGPHKRRSRIFLLDDHEAARRGLARLIELEPDLRVCGDAATVEDALAGIRCGEPDAVVISLEPSDQDGPTAVERLCWSQPSLPLIVVSLREAGAHGRRMLQAGVAGYVMTARAARDIVPAIRRVLGGGIYTGRPQRRTSR